MLSAIILTHNEEKNLKRTLDSVAFCDEILVIDDDSTDNTVGIAKKHGARVVSHSLNADFAAARNFALKHAQGDWVVFVDADEQVTPELAAEILSATKPSSSIVGYFIPRRDTMWNQDLQFGDVGNSSLLRLGQKHAGVWVGKVHEVWQVSGPTQRLSGSIRHCPHPTLYEFLHDINTYSTLRAVELHAASVKPSLFRLLTYPAGKFLQNYLLRQGFRDGVAGTVHAGVMSFHSFLVQSKLFLLDSKWKQL